MTNSMTAFARSEYGAAIWEIRSVNHRYLDTSFRMPENLRHLEVELRDTFKDRVHRGKLECTLKLNATEVTSEITINEPLLKQLSAAINQVTDLLGTDNKGDAASLLRWPDLLKIAEDTDSLAEDVKTGFNAAVNQLIEMRGREGQKLADLINERLSEVTTIVSALSEDIPKIQAAQHEKLHQRIADLNIEADPNRLEQELAILAQKSDVMEELDRLNTHVSEVRRSLGQSEPVGRRLDFLMQELNREANTLSSKAIVSATTLHAVDLKVIIEQMREQIQNIE